MTRIAIPAMLRQYATRWGLLALFALLCSLSPAQAWAGCKFTNGTTANTITVTPPSNLAVSAGDPVGTVVWTSPPAMPANPVWLNCQPNGDSTGIVSTVGPQPPSSGNPVFPTSIPGLGFQVIRNDTGNVIPVYPTGSVPKGKFELNTSVTVRLVVTGVVQSGSLSGALGSWDFVDAGPALSINLGSSVTVASNACSVSSASQNLAVSLPAVAAGAFTGTGSTAGATPFNIQLSCPGGATSNTVLLQMDANNPYSSSVLGNSGTASSIGVQILDGNGSPVQFGTPRGIGTTDTAQIVANYEARYYQTSNNTAGITGSVSATATFTISYQ